MRFVRRKEIILCAILPHLRKSHPIERPEPLREQTTHCALAQQIREMLQCSMRVPTQHEKETPGWRHPRRRPDRPAAAGLHVLGRMVTLLRPQVQLLVGKADDGTASRRI